MVELLVNWIWRWCNDGDKLAWRSEGDGVVARCSALLWHGRERAGCESEMERAAEARALSLHTGLAGQVDTGIRPPCCVPGLPWSATATALSQFSPVTKLTDRATLTHCNSQTS